jgi:hypothetical protein
MSEYQITCSLCDSPVTHECRRWKHVEQETGQTSWRGMRQYHENPLVHALIALLNWKPEGGLPSHTVDAMKESEWYHHGDEDAPFFSQSVIYPLLDWKDNARTLFSLFRSLATAAGLDYPEIQKMAQTVAVREDVKNASAAGGIIPTSEADDLDWIPQAGWTVCLTVHGVGRVEVEIVKVKDAGPPVRGSWDKWVHFNGGGHCHTRRLLRVAHWIKDSEGNQVWPGIPE